MKKPNYLKGLRVVLAILIFVPILLFFVDFADVLPDNLHTLLHLQIMPAILGGMAGLVVFQFVLALLFGRIYCSVICPAGVLQDIINRVFCIGKKKKKGVRRFSYHKPMNILRYSILGLTFVLAVFGMIELCTLLDPYSNFGRIANNLFRPVVMWVNNLLADGLARMDNYTLYHVTISNVTVFGVISALVALLVFIIMVVFRGRLFCNTLCPVGTLLSLISRYSFFRISFDKEACTHCGNCEHTCKAEAIDSKNLTVNRCIVKTEGTDCGACSEHCPTQAVHMVPYEGTLTIPQVNPDLCIGCGGCESICPVRPMRAIIIKANEVHKFVEKPKEEEVKKVEIDDFGF